MGEECIEFDVWVPVRHPLSGERVNVRAIVHERIVSPDAANDLEALFSLEAAANTPDAFDGPQGDQR